MNPGNFDSSFDRVFVNEGGFTDVRGDRGNWTSGKVGEGELKGTKYGISAMTYFDLDIKNLTIYEAKAIYRRDWWDKLSMELLPCAMQYQMFDAALNHGMRPATKMLQNAAGVKADGSIGPVTRATVANTDINDLLMRFLGERLIFMTNVSTWHLFGKGWARRIAHNLKLAAKDN